MQLDGILFDKDGTLFDFARTWNSWAGELIAETCRGEPERAERLAAALRYDLGAQAFRPDSPVIAGTNREAAELAVSALPEWTVEDMEVHLMESAARLVQVPATDLAPLLEALRRAGLKLGVMTNDTEYAARAHLDQAGVTEFFDMVIGFDSGYGAKPDPEPLLAFATAQGLAPGRVAMVGDSTHDLIAGRAAGMVCIAVLTGTALEHELAPFADHVFPDIGHLTGGLAAA
ncbi:HAD family hydrolase [Pseudooceanicola nanhaiensis]|uniref:HAD family hydrolase n=1 Tax=Pseudooceanicola nanhaiensis TaxID=375761 RepID=UPI0035148C4C